MFGTLRQLPATTGKCNYYLEYFSGALTFACLDSTILKAMRLNELSFEGTKYVLQKLQNYLSVYVSSNCMLNTILKLISSTFATHENTKSSKEASHTSNCLSTELPTYIS